MSEFVLKAVDDLTLPVRFKHLQERRKDGRPVMQERHPVIDVVKVELPPLLQQLEAAVTSSMGGPAGKGGLASERSPLDADALFHAVQIRSVIADWCRIVAVRPAHDATRDLRAWYAATLSRGLTQAQEADHVSRMRSWIAFIRFKLEPAREMDLPWSCPICGADTYWDAGKEYRRPLIVRYLPQGADMVNRARALCRACERVWGVRELAYLIEHPEAGEDIEERKA